jgi:hypothetical protein
MFETFYYVTRCLLQYAMQFDDDGRHVVRDESATKPDDPNTDRDSMQAKYRR